MVSIPRIYFHNEVIGQKLAELHLKMKDMADNIAGFKFNRNNISKELLKDDITDERRDLLNKTLQGKREELKMTLEVIPYYIEQIERWKAIELMKPEEEVVFDDLEDVEALI